MAPSSSSSSSSSPSPSSSSKSPPPPPPSHFTPIQECDKEEHADEDEDEDEAPPPRKLIPEADQKPSATPNNNNKKKQQHQHHHHNPTPLHQKTNGGVKKTDDGAWVSCNKCRPSARERISVVPVSDHSSPYNGILKSILSSLTRRSPKPTPTPAREEHWKAAAAELSQKVVQATRKRDEAVLEASRLRRSAADLEKKLDRLERYCHSLRRFDVDDFLSAVSDSRAAVRGLARSLAAQLRHSRVHGGALEALLASALYEDFESPGFRRGGARIPLDPAARREACRAAYESLRRLTWEEVLSRGTRHFSEGFSGFCDRKMSDIVAALAWTRAWPEPLLQAFFAAAKAAWLVHLLAASASGVVEIFRVDPGAPFDPAYMDAAAEKTSRRLAVRVMLAPGFYVGNSVVKCKVVCHYNHNHNNINNNTSSSALISSSTSLPP